MKWSMTCLVGLLTLLAGPATVHAADDSREILALYERIHATLASDSTDGVAAAAASIAKRAEPCECGGAAEAAQRSLVTAAKSMTGADLASLRESFKGLSRSMAVYVAAVGAGGAQLYYCPMVHGYWLQSSDRRTILNPYVGAEMRGCGNRAEKMVD